MSIKPSTLKTKKMFDGLWFHVDVQRPDIPPADYVSILSQLCVLSALARKDETFRDICFGAADSDRLRMKELLDAAVEALRRIGAGTSENLLDISAPLWSLLPLDWIYEVLKALQESRRRPEKIGQWLLQQAQKRLRISPHVPKGIFELVAALEPQAQSIYLPFEAPALALFELTSRTQQVTLRPGTEWCVTLLRRALFAADRKATVQKISPYSGSEAPDADLAVVFPPFGQHPESFPGSELPNIFRNDVRFPSEELALASMAADAGGMVVALVPSGTLFRRGRSESLREWITDKLGLSWVVEFPSGVLADISIGCALLAMYPRRTLGNSTVKLILVDSDEFLSKAGAGRYRLSQWERLAKVAEAAPGINGDTAVDVKRVVIRNNDYLLTPARYQKQQLDELLENSRVANLGSLCTIILPALIRSSDGEATRSYFEVMLSDFQPDGTVQHGSGRKLVDAAAERQARRQLLLPGDILLGIKGSIGKVAMVADAADKRLLANSSTAILRLEDRDRIADPAYLLRYLSQPAVKEFLEAVSGGSAVRFVRRKDLAALRVPIHPPEGQTEVLKTHRRIVAAFAKSRQYADQASRLNARAFKQSTAAKT